MPTADVAEQFVLSLAKSLVLSSLSMSAVVTEPANLLSQSRRHRPPYRHHRREIRRCPIGHNAVRHR
jgi:hypothetical protein